jgi:hypothetical protein
LYKKLKIEFFFENDQIKSEKNFQKKLILLVSFCLLIVPPKTTYKKKGGGAEGVPFEETQTRGSNKQTWNNQGGTTPVKGG